MIMTTCGVPRPAEVVPTALISPGNLDPVVPAEFYAA
jgi:hypothetical protein